MGALLTAPLGMLGSAATSCAGVCCAIGCTKIATAGSTDTTRAVRCVLLWIQVVAALMGALMSWNPKSWLDWACSNMDWGVCECYGLEDENGCYGDQLIYRAEVSAVLVFVILMILSISGCSKQAATQCPGGKFLMLLLLIIVSLFFPNSFLTVFGSVAGGASAAYLVAQTILLMDFAYHWNDSWFQKSENARVALNPKGAKGWIIAITVASLVTFILSVVGLILLWAKFDTGAAHALVVVTFLAGVALFVLSITEWCKHGSMLTSTVVLLYMMWLCYEALSMLPADNGGTTGALLPRWLGLCICAFSLGAFAFTAGSAFALSDPSHANPTEARRENEEALAAEQGAAAQDEDGDDAPEGLDVSDFTLQCAVHCCASVYVAASLAPSKNNWTFTLRVIAVILSLVLYGWSLIAPLVMKTRQF